MEFVEDQEINHLRKFLDSSTSPFHAINNAKKLLLGHGFISLNPWPKRSFLALLMAWKGDVELSRNFLK